MDISNLSANNPYRGRSYAKSPWQGILTTLGFRTQADAWEENMATQAAEYDAAILQKQYDEEYNLPINQVARMRAAGLNPDIDGGSGIDSGSAAPMPEDPSTPMQATSDADSVMPIVNGVLGAFSTAVGIVGTLQNVQKMAIGNEADFASFAKSVSGMLLPDSPEGDAGMMNDFDWRAQAIKNAESFAGKTLPKRMRQKFIDFQTQFWDSAVGKYNSYDEFKKYVTSTRDYYTESQTMWSPFMNVLKEITEPIASMNEQIYKQSQKTQLAEGEAAEAAANTEESYQQALDGSLMGESQNEANELAKTTAQNNQVVQNTIHQITTGLEKASKKGGMEGALASIALVLISGLQLVANSNIHPHISSSNSQATGPRSQKSSEGFSLGF